MNDKNQYDEVLVSINHKLSILINLEAYKLVGQMTVTEGAPILKRLGLSSSEIASVFNTSTGTVKVRLSEAKKKPNK
jgi:DNA-binding transcriptional regulator YiaG